VASNDPAKQLYRFEGFELDVRALEVRKNGVKLKLEGQPVRILCALVERPGELVTREALRRQLWPANTIVDFEHSINAAMMRLRDALGDSADRPRFIETLPRRGYRFIHAIKPIQAPAVSAARAWYYAWRAGLLALAGLLLGALALDAIVS
jgi:DNA-binding winged helix-turn-helix (wHTH) protein